MIRVLILFLSVVFSAMASEKQIQQAQRYIVSIKTRSAVCAYSSEGTSFGTGCVLDHKEGIIVTNAHVAGRDQVVPQYEITLHDGRQLIGYLLYADPWLDIAFIQVNPDHFSPSVESLPLEARELGVGESVYIIGKNENKHFSVQTGSIANFYETSTILHGQVFRISLNAQGGASGSPVFINGKVVGLLLASNGVTSAFAYPTSYILHLLNLLKHQNLSTRRGCGVVLEYVSVDDLVRFYGFPPAWAEIFRKKFPDCFNRALRVSHVVRGTPAEGKFEVGDIVTQVDGEEIGPNLYLFDTLWDKTTKKDRKITVLRYGMAKDIVVVPYALQDRSIRKILVFGGATFYEADDTILRRTGAPNARVFITNIRPGSSFSEKLPNLPRSSSTLVGILSIGGHPISSLDDLKACLPDLMLRKDFPVTFINYGVEFGFDGLLICSQTPQLTEITYTRQDGLPEIYVYNAEQLSWDVTSLGERVSLEKNIA